MRIRAATAADLPVLRDIYADAVLTVGPTAYTQAQVRAWSAFARHDAFADFVLGVNTYVADDGMEIVGFCGIADDGHIVSVYVLGRWTGRGIGAALLDSVLQAHAAPSSGRYYGEASAFSLPLFERCGFRVVGTEQVLHEGETFERFLVEKPMDGA